MECVRCRIYGSGVPDVLREHGLIFRTPTDAGKFATFVLARQTLKASLSRSAVDGTWGVVAVKDGVEYRGGSYESPVYPAAIIGLLRTNDDQEREFQFRREQVRKPECVRHFDFVMRRVRA